MLHLIINGIWISVRYTKGIGIKGITAKSIAPYKCINNKGYPFVTFFTKF